MKEVKVESDPDARAGLIETLFDQHLNAKGYIARGGQMVDASIVPVPKQRNTREENEAVKRGETPAEWERKPAKNRQKDKDARWTKEHSRSFFGYKNHVNVDRTHKLIRRYAVGHRLSAIEGRASVGDPPIDWRR